MSYLDMPFSGLHLKNFKCFADTGALRLAPMTLIFGRNNSGKSSLLQSLILLRQAMDAPSFGPGLNLAGPLYAAGSYTDLVYQHNEKREISISIELQIPGKPPLAPPPQRPRRRVVLTFQGQDPQPPRLSSLTVTSHEEDVSLHLKEKAAGGSPYTMWIGNRIVSAESANFRFPVSSLLPLIGTEQSKPGRPSNLYIQRNETRNFARGALQHLTSLLSGLHVIGAFRSPPERRYEFRGTPPLGADATGRYVIDALIQDALQSGEKRGVLFKGVNEWLQQLARVQLMPLESLDKAGKLYEIRLKDVEADRWANFADVGYGIGQALPVIAEGLQTPPGGTFIVQEPEIHLHPDAQLAMADFLVYLMHSGRQVIVETHSEHLLLRVRRKILAGAVKGLAPAQLSILFVDKDHGAASRAVPLPIDEMGQVANWPAGFLQEANNERMALLEEMAAKIEDPTDG